MASSGENRCGSHDTPRQHLEKASSCMIHRRHQSLLGSPVSVDVVLATTSDVSEVAQAALHSKIGMLVTLKQNIET